MEEHILFSKIQQGDAASFEWLYKKVPSQDVRLLLRIVA